MTRIECDSPAFPVQQQLEAYNARDIDDFMRWWAPDCQYYAFPDTLLASGAEAIRERHVERFKEPDLHGKLLSRIVSGNLVIDHETVTRNLASGKAEIDVVCIYEVSDDKIIRAWFRIGDPV
jgi:putative hydrolase of HD superfamily